MSEDDARKGHIPSPAIGDAKTPPTPHAASEHSSSETTEKHPTWRCIRSVIAYTPPNCRYDPNNPPGFSFGLNLLFAFAACFTVANLYYNHPILDVFAQDFGVTYEQASYIPTLAQAGYAAGLLFLCPLGDLFKRRPFVLWLVLFTATVWLGLCVTNNFAVFCALSFITSVSTVTPQLMLPLVGDLAPPERRATSLAIVVSGLLLGMLIARVLAGTVTNFVSWRVIYWMSAGLQFFILILLWLFMPDYPSTNPEGLTYSRILKSILKMIRKHPLLVQSCLVGFFTASTFTSFWTTLTFLLSSPPYSYSPLVVGLFALIGIGAMSLGPLYARVIIERYVPLFSVVLGEIYCLIGVVIGCFIGEFTVAGPIIQAFLVDIGLQTSQIANRTAIYAIEPLARNRVNTAYMVSVFCGQLMGTAAGNHIYANGGWKHSDGFSIGLISAALLVCIVRGPWETRWVGWGGGWSIKGEGWSESVVPRPALVEMEISGEETDVEKGEMHSNVEEPSSRELEECFERRTASEKETALSSPSSTIVPDQDDDIQLETGEEKEKM